MAAHIQYHKPLVKGVVEQKDDVIHVIAGALFDYTGELANLRVESHDFH